MLQPFIIRPAIQNDIASFQHIEQSSGEIFRSIPDLAFIADDDSADSSLIAETIAKGWALVGIGEGGVISGFVIAEAVKDELHIWQLAVAYEQQRRKMGSGLMQAMIRKAAGQFSAVTLTTFQDVPWNEQFYRTLGFERGKENELSAHLQKALSLERARNLPRRCAMRLSLL